MKKFFKFGCLGFIALIILGVIGAALSDGDEKTSTEPKSQEETKSDKPKEKKAEPKIAKIGETSTVADVGFTVQSVEETQEIDSGNDFIDNATTDGKFIIADVKIDNEKKEALTINSSFFKIKVNGAEYEPVTDGEVIMAMGDAGTDFFLQQINPGLSKSGKVVFEVPADVDLSKAILHCQTGAFGTETTEIKLSK
ncbi:DUF4352 domain-containing protein [Cytobacillus firmus]|uniref:DUF4352 domain-containing protein n=1 Tax=Cytobacillus firmus TaxID=1399 RepID=A0A800MRR3_CYTFI|nr:DUF4352 domain-containing protein [Cytobacillus firmus]KAF0821269.1 hypothetical protein KIS1582_5019 [Cytobacillus firmus]MBG9546779.1 hypothetical protein [Cytobacillus firmus]MBG9600909.1 hypothetical protein [Cytobacillus firmus]MBG9656174.1 hypothetical protein [Cytobacillus firmus]MDD9314207.1 DUF4352 domain-containing protein [Cytobacillus firmus]